MCTLFYLYPSHRKTDQVANTLCNAQLSFIMAAVAQELEWVVQWLKVLQFESQLQLSAC